MGKASEAHFMDVSKNYYAIGGTLGPCFTVSHGFTYNFKQEDKGNIAVAYTGNGCTQEGAFFEALNYAKAFRPPVLSIIQNNHFTIPEDFRKMSRLQQLSQCGAGFSIPYETLENGNDVELVVGEIDYDGIQLGEVGGRQMGYPLNDPRVQAVYQETAVACGIELHSLNLGALLAEGTMNYAPETTQGRYARESLRKGFEVCRALDIGTVVITVNLQDEEQTSNVLSHLSYAVRLASEVGVEIAMESAQELPVILGILECMQGKIKICMDTLNPLRFGCGDPQEQICIFSKERISHFHLKDSKQELFRIGERDCTLLGTGEAGFAESVKLIQKMQ